MDVSILDNIITNLKCHVPAQTGCEVHRLCRSAVGHPHTGQQVPEIITRSVTCQRRTLHYSFNWLVKQFTPSLSSSVGKTPLYLLCLLFCMFLMCICVYVYCFTECSFTDWRMYWALFFTERHISATVQMWEKTLWLITDVWRHLCTNDNFIVLFLYFLDGSCLLIF